MPDFSGTSAVAIAKEKGFFDEEHLDVTLIKFLDGPSEVEEMLLKMLIMNAIWWLMLKNF